ncbi:MAG TPA: hypothetical protein DEP23_00385 [Ruminococcaceae bacterium]|nr:hypothetical protein [Oscillospiraceae bacterium]
MAKLDFIEKDLINELLNCGGYVLDFSNRTYQEFVWEKIQVDVYAKYPGLSKGKILRAIMTDFPDVTAGKLLLEFLRYMQAKDMVNDQNREKFKICADIGCRLIGKSNTVKKPASTPVPPKPITSAIDFDKYIKELTELSYHEDTPQSRGFAFEKYLQSLFDAAGLQPRGSFKVVGEQIDGSFVLKNEVYLLEAKWTSKPIDKGQLVIFNEKDSSKSGFTRGLFISYSDFSSEALASFANGRSVNIILMSVQELAIALSRQIEIDTLLWTKVRALAECGEFYKSVFGM